MLLVLGMVGLASAKPVEALHPGELYGHWSGWTGNAYTTPKGMVALHPCNRSSIGIADGADLKIAFIGALFKPHLAAEIGFVQTDNLAVSIEMRGAVPWRFQSVDYGVVPHLSVRAGPAVLVDLSLGVHGFAGVDTSDNPFPRQPGLNAVRPEIAFDFALSEPTWFVLTARSDALAWSTAGAQGTVGGYFAYGKDAFGLSAGVNLTMIGLAGINRDIANLEQIGQVDLPNLPPAIPIPLPHLQLWIRL